MIYSIQQKSMYNFFKVFGLKEILGTSELWPLLLGLTGVFALFQIIMLPFCKESPRLN